MFIIVFFVASIERLGVAATICLDIAFQKPVPERGPGRIVWEIRCSICLKLITCLKQQRYGWQSAMCQVFLYKTDFFFTMMWVWKKTMALQADAHSLKALVRISRRASGGVNAEKTPATGTSSLWFFAGRWQHWHSRRGSRYSTGREKYK